MSDKIKEYFGRFGEVNSMEILQRDNIQYGLIEFKKTESAEKVLAAASHCIEDCHVEVKAAEPWHQPKHILNALDDRCLHKILSNLSLVDLTNAANVCVRFNLQARTVFSTKYQRLDLIEYAIEKAKNIIQTFGSLAHSIDIKAFPESVTDYGDGNIIFDPKDYSEILSMIDSCCTPVLRELKLIEYDFEDTHYNEKLHGSAFNTLEKLIFQNCQLTSNVKSLLALCHELKSLEFNKCCWSYEDVCVLKYEKLEELRLVKKTEFDDRTLKRFVILNPNLKKLSFVELGERDISVSKTLQSIAENLPNLLELEFEQCTYSNDFAKSLRHFPKLTSLKVLKMDLTTITVKQLCDVLTSNDTPIEYLRLNFGKIDKHAIESISQMKKLKILKFYGTDCTDDDLMELAKGLGHQLEELGLLWSTAQKVTTIGLKKLLPFAKKLSHFNINSDTITIDLDDYKAMLDVIKKRPEKRSLLLELSGQTSHVHVHVPKTMLLENSDILNIKEVDKSSIIDCSDDDDSSSNYSSDSDPYAYGYYYDSDNYSFGSD